MRYFYLIIAVVVTVLVVTRFTNDEQPAKSEIALIPDETSGHVPTLVSVIEKPAGLATVKNGLLAQSEQPQTMRELQKHYDDYYALALELLHRARAGDGVSQLNLAELLLHCQQVVLIDVDDDISILLAADVSIAEADMLKHLRSEVAKCANFQNIDYKFFEDINYDNEQVLDRTLYWITKSFRNGVTDAAAYLMGLHLSEVIKLSDDERLLAAKMVREELARPSLATLTYLAHLSSTPHSFRVVAALKQEPGFFRESDELQFSTAEIGIIPCLERSVLWAEPVTPRYDCAENISRYGGWIEPELIPEVEAEIEKVKQAWKKGDYAAAGFEALIPFLEHPNN